MCLSTAMLESGIRTLEITLKTVNPIVAASVNPPASNVSASSDKTQNTSTATTTTRSNAAAELTETSNAW